MDARAGSAERYRTKAAANLGDLTSFVRTDFARHMRQRLAKPVPVDLNVTTAKERTKALLGPQGQGPNPAHSAVGRSQAYQSGPILMRVRSTSMVSPSMMILLATDAVASISWRNPQITLNYERTPACQRIVAYCASRAWERC